MKSLNKFVGLDDSKDTSSVAVAYAARAPARSTGGVPNTPGAAHKLIPRLRKPDELLVRYEAGLAVYGLYRFLGRLQVTVHRGDSVANTDTSWRSDHNGPPRWVAPGSASAGRQVDVGLGSRRRA